jgi:hypothetical protein
MNDTMNNEADAAPQPGTRLTLFYRGNALWIRREKFCTREMLLMSEYYRVSYECHQRGLPLPQPPPMDDPKNRDETVIAYHVSEKFARPLLPAEIALQSRNQADVP